MRATGAEDTLLDLTTAGDSDSRPSTGVLDLLKDNVDWTDNSTEKESLTHDLETNGMEIYIAGSSAHSKVANWYLTLWRNENGPAKRVAQGTCTTGTQAVVKYPHNGIAIANMFWCDQIVVLWHNLAKGIVGTDSDGKSNSVGSIWFDLAGYRYALLEFRTSEVSVETRATNLVAYYGRF